MFTTYGVLNLIVSIIVEQTLQATESNESRQKQKEESKEQNENEYTRDIFLLSDADGNGDLTKEEFAEAYATDGEVQWRVKSLELPVEDVKRLFAVVEGVGSRNLNMHEFQVGCTKLKGVARSKDLLALQSQADSMSKQMDRLGRELHHSEKMLARLDEASQRMTSRFGVNVLSSRRALHERVRGSAPSIPLPTEKGGSLGETKLSVGNIGRLPDLPNLLFDG
jgi:hypothetical protein